GKVEARLVSTDRASKSSMKTGQSATRLSPTAKPPPTTLAKRSGTAAWVFPADKSGQSLKSALTGSGETRRGSILNACLMQPQSCEGVRDIERWLMGTAKRPSIRSVSRATAGGQ